MTVAAGAETSIVPNGGMEGSAVGAASEWSMQKPDDANGAVSIVEAPVKSGERALLLKGQGQWMTAYTAPILIDQGKPYRASAWIRTRVGHARIQINHWAGEKWLGASDGTQRITTDEWQEVAVESDPKKYTEATHIRIGIVSDGPEVEVYADDVAMSAR